MGKTFHEDSRLEEPQPHGSRQWKTEGTTDRFEEDGPFPFPYWEIMRVKFYRVLDSKPKFKAKEYGRDHGAF